MAVEHAIKNHGAFVDIGCAYGIAALEGICEINIEQNLMLKVSSFYFFKNKISHQKRNERKSDWNRFLC